MADSEQVAHLLRRAGFGATAADFVRFEAPPLSEVVDYLVDYDRLPDDVYVKIGQSAFLGPGADVTSQLTAPLTVRVRLN